VVPSNVGTGTKMIVEVEDRATRGGGKLKSLIDVEFGCPCYVTRLRHDPRRVWLRKGGQIAEIRKPASHIGSCRQSSNCIEAHFWMVLTNAVRDPY